MISSKNTLEKIHSETPKNSNDDKDISYFKLPYIGKFSNYTKQKNNRLCKTFFKNINLQIVFTQCKLSNYFSSKDSVPNSLNSSVVYHFECANCQIEYVGKTYRHLHERVKEHFKQSASHIFKHLDENPL